MHILKSKANLNEPIEYFTFIEEFVHFCFSFDMITEITYFTILHYDDKHIKGKIRLFVSYDVLMIQVFK